MSPEFGCRDELEVGFAGQQASKAADRVFHATFLPRAVRVAEECLNAEGLVKSMVLGELVSVVEADGPEHRLRKFTEPTDDVLSRGNSFSADRTVNYAEASLSFVKNQQSLISSGEHHKVGLPMAWRLATFDLSGSLSDRAPLSNKAAGATAPPSTTAYFLVTREQAIPVIPLGRTMIDETID